jgi:microcystin-dependent protein
MKVHSSCISNGLSIFLTLILVGWMSYYAYSAYNYNNTQDVRSDIFNRMSIINNTQQANAISAVNNSVASINMTLTMLVDVFNFLFAGINTTGNGTSILELLQRIDIQLDDSISTINGVHGVTGTRNLNMMDAGLGHIVITNTPITHTILVDLGTTVAASIVEGNEPSGGLNISLTSPNTYTITNKGVLTISGVKPDPTMGNVFVTGSGMINVIPQPNSSTVVVDGSQIVSVLSSLQTMDLTQQSEISALNNSVTMLQMQVASIEQAEAIINQSLNGTVVSFNMSLTYLFETVMMLQMQVSALETQLANVTTTGTPTGSILPWSGSDGGAIPSGYLLCDGTEYASATFMPLFGVIGTMYCPSMGGCAVGNFAVPDMRGRVPVGKRSTGIFNSVIGTVVGAETKSLDAFELPSHSHLISGTTDFVGGHNHRTDFTIAGSDYGSVGGINALGVPGNICNSGYYPGAGGGPGTPTNSILQANCAGPNSGAQDAWLSNVDGGHSHPLSAASAGISSSGANQAFSIAQPSMVMQFIIKT